MIQDSIIMEYEKKTAEGLLIWLIIKLVLELQTFQKIHNKIIQRMLQMKVIKKCLKKDIYFQKKRQKICWWSEINLKV